MTMMCFDSANLQGTGATRKRAGGGRAGYVRREVLTPVPPTPKDKQIQLNYG